MDLIRSSIEAVFYHLPVEVIAEIMLQNRLSNGKKFIDRIAEIIYRTHPEFTSSDINLFCDIVMSSWLVDNDVRFKKFDQSSVPSRTILERLPLLLNLFAQNILSCHGNTPVVKFQSLLRWRELSLLVGEDIIVLPYIARLDQARKKIREDFCWPNVIGHDNFRLNSILNEHLSDTHSHVNAAQDVFEFNWLALMNHPHLFFSNKSGTLRSDDEQMEYDAIARYTILKRPMRFWIVIAAAIRLLIFKRKLDRLKKKEEKAKDTYYISVKELKSAIGNDKDIHNLITKVDNLIGRYSEHALKADDILVLDYAIRKKDFREISPSPYLIHHGERSLLYDWFRRYFSGEEGCRRDAGLMVMYLLIKCKIRREFLQTNSLNGFLNFQTYQQNKLLGFDILKTDKDNFLDPLAESYKSILFRYAVQTSIGEESNHYLEARLVPESVKSFQETDLSKSIFKKDISAVSLSRDSVSVVAHFIKYPSEDKGSCIRNNKLRETLWKQADTLIEIYKTQDKEKPLLVGVDAASSELKCRPEVFAPMFRFLRFHGVTNFTFHAGEDFYDILDGLRTIAETLDFMGYSTGCRIGHGLALGINPYEFYAKRHRIIIVPRQYLLDNLVWLKFFAASHNITLSPETSYLIEEQYSKLISELGYSSIVTNMSMWEYWQSMLMRGDFVSPDQSGRPPFCDEIMYSPVSPKGMNLVNISKLHDHYERNSECRTNGEMAEMVNVPKSFAQDIKNVQDCILNKMEYDGIVIETNPSSNIKIGRFNRYDQHPITLFHDVRGDALHHSMVVTINTDDKGVFATSLRNEYSLIAIALMKQYDSKGTRIWSDLEIEKYLKRIARYGNISRFKIS